MNFANIRNNEIIDMNSKYLDKDIIRVEVSDEIYQAYVEDRNKVVYQDGEIILNPNYEAEQEFKERERINSLMIDSTTFYKEILRTSSNTRKNIQDIIQTTNTFSDYQKESLLIDLQNTLNLIRGSYFVNTIGVLLDYTTEDLNYLFENKIFPY